MSELNVKGRFPHTGVVGLGKGFGVLERIESGEEGSVQPSSPLIDEVGGGDRDVNGDLSPGVACDPMAFGWCKRWSVS